MTLEEKALLCVGDSHFSTYPIDRLGIPKVWLLDGATGVNLGQLYADIVLLHRNDPDYHFKDVTEVTISDMRFHIPDRSAMGPDAQALYDEILAFMAKRMPKHILPGCFPPGMMLGATGDPEAVYNCGSAMARELDAYGIDMILGPNVNIHRDPRNGRIYEGYSEDPCVVASLAPAFIKGMQDDGLIADAKHFAANSQESYRQNIDEHIPERALQEIYLPGFKACVDGGVKTLMSAYNKINGAACAMNHWLLTDELRGSWGFDGLVVSDWGAAYEMDKAIAAGNDLIMPGRRDITPIIDAVNAGTLSMEALDEAVSNVLKMILQTNTFRGSRKYPYIDVEYSRKAAYDVAAEGITLLKNDGILPLRGGAKLSFFGDGCKKFIESGFGSTYIRTDRSTALVEMCKAYTDTCCFGEVQEDTDCVIVTVRAGGQEGSDRNGLNLDKGEHEMALEAISAAKACGKKVVLVLNVSGPVDLRDFEPDCDAIVCVYLPGMEGGRALADILFGRVNPSGKLPITFPQKLEDVPAYLNFPGSARKVVYGEGIYVGYRYYDTKKIKPMYPFGFGLSYTQFELSNLKLDKKLVHTDEGECVKASVTLRNCGTMDGKDTVQLYISDPKSFLPKPAKELKALKKVFVPAGKETTVDFTVTAEMLKSYDDDLLLWTLEPGEYDVLIGDASDNIACAASFTVECDSPYNFNTKTSLDRILHHEKARNLLYRTIEECGWDAGRLDDAAEYFPDREILAELQMVFPYDEKKNLWKNFFEEISIFA